MKRPPRMRLARSPGLAALALALTVAVLAVAAAVPLAPARAQPGGAPRTSCLGCHADPEQAGEESQRLVEGFRSDVHAQVGLSCHDCHGGNPDPALAGDLAAAMDERFPPRPYIGVPERPAIPAFCARCHSDPATMKRFRPDVRVDQEREYWTSQHGKALGRGNVRVATCIDCHGVHGIRRPSDPSSSVYPTRVAETCRSCHADPERMAGALLADGRPLPVDQYARWRQSVHAQALLEKEDLSAPTCNDCHGNHGAAPPGLDSIAFVCGQCHGREAELFRQSAKRAGFEQHNELLAQAGGGGCTACHAAPEPQAELTAIRSFSECTSCHENHGVVRPTMAMLSPLPETPCAFCHEGQGPLAAEVPEPRRAARRYAPVRDGLLEEARAQGLTGEARFNWLVDQALLLFTHTVAGEDQGSEEAPPKLRPEFEHLFTKFRIGKTVYSYLDPATGAPVTSPVIRCSACHAPQEAAASGAAPGGLATGEAFLGRMRELTALSARAERLLLAARRGGVETRQALQDIDDAVNAQIELEVLVHTFSSDEGSAFMSKHAEGLKHAEAALLAGRDALRELGYRRTGLSVALGIILLVLVGLGLKIRTLPAPAEEDEAPRDQAGPSMAHEAGRSMAHEAGSPRRPGGEG